MVRDVILCIILWHCAASPYSRADTSEALPAIRSFRQEGPGWRLWVEDTAQRTDKHGSRVEISYGVPLRRELSDGGPLLPSLKLRNQREGRDGPYEMSLAPRL